MVNVKLEVLQSSFKEIRRKLIETADDAKIDDDSSKLEKKIELFALFNDNMKELTSNKFSVEQLPYFVTKINKILDEFSELFQKQNLKSHINDAYKKRLKSKGEKKVTLKMTTFRRVSELFDPNDMEDSFNDNLNKLLDSFDVLYFSLKKDMQTNAAEVHSTTSKLPEGELSRKEQSMASKKDRKQKKKVSKNVKK